MQLGSLRQIILFSFFLALLPLMILLWQTQQSLQHVVQLYATQARQAVDLTRDIELLQRRSRDLERLVRQYNIIKNAQLQGLISQQLQQVLQSLSNLCDQAPQQTLCEQLKDTLARLDENSDENTLSLYFAGLSQQLNEFETLVAEQLDASLASQQLQVSDMQSRLTWQTLALVLTTVLMVWGGSQLILGPVQQLRNLINAIGTRDKALPLRRFEHPYELAQLDTRLRWLAFRLQELESVRHAMLRHASHELKTPLASLSEGCALLADEVVGELSTSQREVVGLLNDSVRRMQNLVEELLDYNRLLQDAESRPVQLAIAPFLDEVLTSHRLTAAQQHQQIDCQIEAQNWLVDKNLLTRVMDNLLNNAVAYGLQDSTIVLRIWNDENHQMLQVTNASQSTQSLDPKRLLEPFERGGQERNDGRRGSGLGLSIVADCVRMMGGKLDIVAAGSGEFSVLVSIPMHRERV